MSIFIILSLILAHLDVYFLYWQFGLLCLYDIDDVLNITFKANRTQKSNQESTRTYCSTDALIIDSFLHRDWNSDVKESLFLGVFF